MVYAMCNRGWGGCQPSNYVDDDDPAHMKLHGPLGINLEKPPNLPRLLPKYRFNSPDELVCII